MKIAFRESFAKDLKTIKDKALLKRLQRVIETVEKADSLSRLPHLK